jgi:aspartokinase-like uncharacterized kinase
MSRAVVVKVGGSLFDLPDLGPRLETWLKQQAIALPLVVPGGGRTADVVRDLDRTHSLGEETAHWLALRGLTLNAWFLCRLLSGWKAEVVKRTEDCALLWARSALPVLDPHAFARADEGRPGSLPHRWSVSSDSLAARAAVVLGAKELILLKSAPLPPGAGWAQAGRLGFVDPCFPEMAGAIPSVRAVNFRISP